MGRVLWCMVVCVLVGCVHGGQVATTYDQHANEDTASGLTFHTKLYGDGISSVWTTAGASVSRKLHRTKTNGTGEAEPDGVERLFRFSHAYHWVPTWSLNGDDPSYKRFSLAPSVGVGYGLLTRFGSEEVDILNIAEVDIPDFKAGSGPYIVVGGKVEASVVFASFRCRWYIRDGFRCLGSMGITFDVGRSD